MGLSAARPWRAAAGPGADGEEGGGRLPDAGAATPGRRPGGLTATEQPTDDAPGAADGAGGELQDRTARDARHGLHDRRERQQAADVVLLQPPAGHGGHGVDAS